MNQASLLGEKGALSLLAVCTKIRLIDLLLLCIVIRVTGLWQSVFSSSLLVLKRLLTQELYMGIAWFDQTRDTMLIKSTNCWLFRFASASVVLPAPQEWSWLPRFDALTLDRCYLGRNVGWEITHWTDCVFNCQLSNRLASLFLT